MPPGSRLYTFGVVPLAPQDLSQLSHPRIVVGLSPMRTLHPFSGNFRIDGNTPGIRVPRCSMRALPIC